MFLFLSCSLPIVYVVMHAAIPLRRIKYYKYFYNPLPQNFKGALVWQTGLKTDPKLFRRDINTIQQKSNLAKNDNIVGIVQTYV